MLVSYYSEANPALQARRLNASMQWNTWLTIQELEHALACSHGLHPPRDSIASSIEVTMYGPLGREAGESCLGHVL